MKPSGVAGSGYGQAILRAEPQRRFEYLAQSHMEGVMDASM